FSRDWSSDVCSSDLLAQGDAPAIGQLQRGLHLVLEVVDGLAVGAQGLDLEVLAVLRVFVEQQPHEGVRESRLARGVVTEHGHVRSEERRVGNEWRSR